MRKYSGREKTILKLLAFAALVALGLEVFDWYSAKKQALRDEIDNKNGQVAAFLKELENENAEVYRRRAEEIDKRLLLAQDRVLELPRETDANLLISKTITERAEDSGVTVNSISNRRSVEIEGSPMTELRTYFAYETKLEAFLEFFQALDNQGYYMVIESLNLSARRSVYRSNRRNIKRRNTNVRQRAPMTGNAVIATLFTPNPNASLERYQTPASDGAAAPAKQPPPPPELEKEAEPMSTEAQKSEMLDNLPAGQPDLNKLRATLRNKQRELSPDAAKQAGDVLSQLQPKQPEPMQVKPKRLTDASKRDKKKKAKTRF